MLCDICGGELKPWKKTIWGGETQIFECDCGFKQQDYSRIVENKYYKQSLPHRSVTWFEEADKRTQRQYEVFKGLLDDCKCVDLGCGPGTLEYFIKKNNIKADVFSVDVCNQFIDIAKQRNIKVISLDIRQDLSDVLGNDFDFIYSSHSFEHVDCPSRVLSNWLKLLRVGGSIFIEVPDSESIYSERGLELDHLSYFNESSLCGIFSKCGLVVDYVNSINIKHCGAGVVNILGTKMEV